MIMGVIILVTFIIPKALKLQGWFTPDCAVVVLTDIYSSSNIGLASENGVDGLIYSCVDVQVYYNIECNNQP